ncbi:MAG: hypothetical protein J1F35_06405 [Erysipelotrichales bacterium]|nr:hypothetical protein [Erysipelotrichales bacterium]
MGAEGDVGGFPGAVFDGNVVLSGYNYEIYCATAALQLFSMMDPNQYANPTAISSQIIKRAEIFGSMARERWPRAFK